MKHTLLLLATCSSVATAQVAAQSPQAVSLFNGKDLTGWKGQGYTVKNGVITCTPKGGNLVTAKAYTNYIFEFEFKLPSGGNNGLGIHYPGQGGPHNSGMEIQILDDTHPKYNKLKPYQFHGGLYTLQAAQKGFLKPVGEWNYEKVTVNGSTVTVELNGTVINIADLDQLQKKYPKHPGVKRRSGHICFCGHNDPVQFRNIKITELPLKLPAPETKGFTQLYNGKDLSGWKQDPGHNGHWQPRGDVLHYDGQSKAKDKNLWSEKSYKDFTLICDWRWVDKGNKKAKRPLLDPATGGTRKGVDGKPIHFMVDELDSGIYLRGRPSSQVNIWNWPGGSGEVYGYRTNRRMPLEVRKALTPKVRADHPVGQWNRFIITMKGDRLTVVLNGKTVIDKAQLPGVAPSGPIALQHHGQAIEFRNIYIKEL